MYLIMCVRYCISLHYKSHPLSKNLLFWITVYCKASKDERNKLSAKNKQLLKLCRLILLKDSSSSRWGLIKKSKVQNHRKHIPTYRLLPEEAVWPREASQGQRCTWTSCQTGTGRWKPLSWSDILHTKIVIPKNYKVLYLHELLYKNKDT